MQQRAKLVIPRIARHTLRLHSCARMHKLPSTAAKMLAFIEIAVHKDTDRVVGPPPAPETLGDSLEIRVDMIHKPDQLHHHTGRNGQLSIRMKDLLEWESSMTGIRGGLA